MTADDGTSHWILGMSANGKGRGLPATYAYWTGAFDGASFVPDHGEPQNGWTTGSTSTVQ